jgi:SAM-dependent methyltransferase
MRIQKMRNWHEISKDPNAPAVLEYRRNCLINAKSNELIKDRIKYLSSLAKDKSVLDVGVVEHTHEAVNSPEWLHKNLAREAATCLGVDILEEEVNYLVSLGFNIVCADIVTKPLSEKFDLIVCGEVLEHVGNVADFLNALASMLKPSGRIVVTVPNPWYINVIVKNMIGKNPYVDNVDHVSWFDPCTLTESGKRNHLLLDKYSPIMVDQPPSLLSKVFFRLTPVLIFLGFQPHIFAKTMIYEFIPEKENDK